MTHDREGRQTFTRKFLKHRLIRRKLGQLPAMSLYAMTDYGLDDGEIGRYFRVTPSSVRRLKRVLARRR